MSRQGGPCRAKPLPARSQERRPIRPWPHPGADDRPAGASSPGEEALPRQGLPPGGNHPPRPAPHGGSPQTRRGLTGLSPQPPPAPGPGRQNRKEGMILQPPPTPGYPEGRTGRGPGQTDGDGERTEEHPPPVSSSGCSPLPEEGPPPPSAEPGPPRGGTTGPQWGVTTRGRSHCREPAALQGRARTRMGAALQPLEGPPTAAPPPLRKSQAKAQPRAAKPCPTPGLAPRGRGLPPLARGPGGCQVAPGPRGPGSGLIQTPQQAG